MEYYVRTPLSHDGTTYNPGAMISLDEIAAAPLLADSVIQTSPPAPEPEAPETQPEPEPQPVAGGEPLDTGEPSVDGTESAPAPSEATDITPETAPEPEAPRRGRKAKAENDLNERDRCQRNPGVDTASNTRAAQLTGVGSETASRPAQLAGKAIAQAVRMAQLTGARAPGSDSRGAQLEGTLTRYVSGRPASILTNKRQDAIVLTKRQADVHPLTTVPDRTVL
jgi:hypothetical protein